MQEPQSMLPAAASHNPVGRQAPIADGFDAAEEMEIGYEGALPFLTENPVTDPGLHC